jgi:hypothetical protein
MRLCFTFSAIMQIRIRGVFIGIDLRAKVHVTAFYTKDK